jgi:hypothetical protein
MRGRGFSMLFLFTAALPPLAAQVQLQFAPWSAVQPVRRRPTLPGFWPMQWIN